jgi:hypothetical protein
MRLFLYTFASFCAISAFILLVAPAIAGVLGGRTLLTGLMGIGVSNGISSFATALAVIPLCIAVAFDRLTAPA